MVRRTVFWIMLATVVAVTVPAPPATAAAPAPVVLAVDTSRSLTSTDLATVRARLRGVLAALPDSTPVGVLAFNDAPEWLVPVGASPQRAAAALDRLHPAGRFTVLHDALFTAARRLDHGGVILVLTDGRDENSATTVEDVARLCVDNDVHVVAASVGRHIDQRALRRLALLTDGNWVGSLARTDTAAVADAVRGRSLAVAGRKAAAAAPTAPPAATAPPQPESAARQTLPPAPVVPRWILWPALTALAVLIVTVLAVSLRRRGRAARTCPRCGAELQPWDDNCPHCQVADLEGAAQTQEIAESAQPVDFDPEVFAKAPTPQGLERTLVLEEQPMLVVKQSGHAARTFSLPKDQVFVVGRAPGVNTLQVEDPSVSAQHFKIVPKDGSYYVIDLETTNGTSVNDQRITVRRLSAGDTIRAGRIDFQFKMTVRRLS
ncbi:MAG: FHA domain-containing protein [Acidobacteria bacterium]|nr:FHA domain-containing protein [Acidobacteriota bacterium]